MRRIAVLSVSALVVLVAPPLYLLLDLAVVGRLGGHELAALGVGTLVLATISTQLTFLSYGTTARSARLFGAGDRAGAVREGVQATWVALGVGVVLIALAYPLAPVVLGALVGSGEDGAAEVIDEATRWLRIAMFGVPLILASMAGNGWMRGVQDTRRPVLFVLCGLSIGAVGVVGLVHGLAWFPRLGLTGSAVANVAGQSITGALFVGRLVGESRRGDAPLSLRPDRSIIAAQLVMARDLILRSLSFQVCFVSATAVAARFGIAAVAAHQVAVQVWDFVSLLLDSVAIAAQSLVGAALGAGTAGVAVTVARRVTVVAVAIAVVMAAVFAVGAGIIPGVFTHDAEVRDAMSVPWWFLVGMLPIAAVVFALDGVLLGAGDVVFLRKATMFSALCGFLPLIWLSLVFGWGLAGIWSGLVALMVLRLVLVVGRVLGGRWQRVGADAVT